MRHVVAKILVLSFSFLTLHTLCAFHNASRYFPFLERPDNYLARKRPYVNIATFYTTASSAYKPGGEKAGMLELGGLYDLQDIIKSLQMVQPTLQNPIVATTGSQDLVNKSIKFKAGGKIKSVGLILNYEHDLQWHGLSFGLWLPIMRVTTTGRYKFNQKDFAKNYTLP